MLYEWSFSLNTAQPIDFKQIKYYLSFNTKTTEFYWSDGIQIKIEHKEKNYVYGFYWIVPELIIVVTSTVLFYY